MEDIQRVSFIFYKMVGSGNHKFLFFGYFLKGGYHTFRTALECFSDSISIGIDEVQCSRICRKSREISTYGALYVEWIDIKRGICRDFAFFSTWV